MQKLVGTEIIKQLNQSNIEYVLSVPDITTSENILKPLINNNEIKVIQVCKEDEAISISAGLYAAALMLPEVIFSAARKEFPEARSIAYTSLY